MTVSQFIDHAPKEATFMEDVLAGLKSSPKTVPCKYFYDERGSQLFDRITELDEYYVTRTELDIMRANAAQMAEALGPRCLLIEFGSGSSVKTRVLLDELKDPAAYVPLDISREHLLKSANELSSLYPDLEIIPVCSDYNEKIEPPKPKKEARRVAVYFPGSTIGNLHPNDAAQFLHRIRRMCGREGALLIGVDLKKDREVLEAAYNDHENVTAEFNMNLLRRINRELHGTFAPHRFAHNAVYNEVDGRIEMHLISLVDQEVRINGGTSVQFTQGESIRTECSYKYGLNDFRKLASLAGFEVKNVWTDDKGYFSVQYLA